MRSDVRAEPRVIGALGRRRAAPGAPPLDVKSGSRARSGVASIAVKCKPTRPHRGTRVTLCAASVAMLPTCTSGPIASAASTVGVSPATNVVATIGWQSSSRCAGGSRRRGFGATQTAALVAHYGASVHTAPGLRSHALH